MEGSANDLEAGVVGVTGAGDKGVGEGVAGVGVGCGERADGGADRGVFGDRGGGEEDVGGSLVDIDLGAERHLAGAILDGQRVGAVEGEAVGGGEGAGDACRADDIIAKAAAGRPIVADRRHFERAGECGRTGDKKEVFQQHSADTGYRGDEGVGSNIDPLLLVGDDEIGVRSGSCVSDQGAAAAGPVEPLTIVGDPCTRCVEEVEVGVVQRAAACRRAAQFDAQLVAGDQRHPEEVPIKVMKGRNSAGHRSLVETATDRDEAAGKIIGSGEVGRLPARDPVVVRLGLCGDRRSS